jgi:hypothetical protein
VICVEMRFVTTALDSQAEWVSMYAFKGLLWCKIYIFCGCTVSYYPTFIASSDVFFLLLPLPFPGEVFAGLPASFAFFAAAAAVRAAVSALSRSSPASAFASSARLSSSSTWWLIGSTLSACSTVQSARKRVAQDRGERTSW